MNQAEAMQCCRSIRNHLDSARRLIVDFYDREGWKSLGYESWRECVVAEFGQSKSHLYRQLEAAYIEREISPMGEIGTIPERQIRPLASVPEGDRKAAWDLANETAPGGKVTARHVQTVVDEVVPKPSRSRPAPNAPAPVPAPEPGPPELDHEALAAAIEDEWSAPIPPPAEPSDIMAQRRAGIIPEGVEVSVSDPEPAVDDEPVDVMAEQSDEEFLAECPARAKLNAPSLKVFDRDALLFRSVSEHRDAFRRRVQPLINANKRRLPTGNYHHFLTSFLIRKHPRQWVACGLCVGTGRDEFGECNNCHGRGYLA